MSEAITLEAKPRDVIGKRVKSLRRAGQAPIILYGPKIKPMSLTVDARELREVLIRAGGTTIVEIHVGKKSYPTLARDVQRHVLKDTILHVDFYRVAMDQTIRAEVQVIATGEPTSIADGEGKLVSVTTTLEIEALPANLVPSLEVDVSGLETIGDLIYVSDIEAPAGVAIVSNPEDVVFKIDYIAALPEEEKEEEEEFMLEERAADEVEVIGRAREEEEKEGEE